MTVAKAPPPLTDAQWDEVFRCRCKTKQGQLLTEQQTFLVRQAHSQDPERYRSMTDEVFRATAPFGSAVGR